MNTTATRQGIALKRSPKWPKLRLMWHSYSLRWVGWWHTTGCDFHSARWRRTFNPRSSSFRDRRISDVKPFMRSHSWKATITYGVRSSTGTFDMISCMLNGSGKAPTISSSIDLICAQPGEPERFESGTVQDRDAAGNRVRGISLPSWLWGWGASAQWGLKRDPAEIITLVEF